MTANTKIFLQTEATSNNNKQHTQQINIQCAESKGEGRKGFHAMIALNKLETEAEALTEALTAELTDPLYIVSSIITVHGLKVAARGRMLRDENGKPKKDNNGNIRFTGANLTALKVLRMGLNGTDGIIDDLRQTVSLAIWEAIQAGKVEIITINKQHELKSISGNDETDKQTLRSIYNTVQNFLYQNQQKHYKREYIPVIDENGNETAELNTKAMRHYAMSLHAIDKDELFQSLTAILNETETAVLYALYDNKRVQRKAWQGQANGTSKPVLKYITRKKTQTELSIETGYSIQTVKTAQKNIRMKLTAVLNEAGNIRRTRQTHSNKNGLSWINLHGIKFPTNAEYIYYMTEAEALAEAEARHTRIIQEAKQRRYEALVNAYKIAMQKERAKKIAIYASLFDSIEAEKITHEMNNSNRQTTKADILPIMIKYGLKFTKK